MRTIEAEFPARVVYGDTDRSGWLNRVSFVMDPSRLMAALVYEPHSIFVLLPGMSHEDAFVAGQAMADRITALNPKPVKLKFEKVGRSWRA